MAPRRPHQGCRKGRSGPRRPAGGHPRPARRTPARPRPAPTDRPPAAGRPAGDSRLRRRATPHRSPRPGPVRHGHPPHRRRREGSGHGRGPLPSPPAHPDHRRPPPLLGRLVARSAQGDGQPLPQAPLADGPHRRRADTSNSAALIRRVEAPQGPPRWVPDDNQGCLYSATGRQNAVAKGPVRRGWRWVACPCAGDLPVRRRRGIALQKARKPTEWWAF